MPNNTLPKPDKLICTNKPAAPRKRTSVKLENPVKPKPRKVQKTSKKTLPEPPANRLRNKLLLIGLETLGLTITAISAIMILLGYSANRFSGTRFFTSLLPFAIDRLVEAAKMAAHQGSEIGAVSGCQLCAGYGLVSDAKPLYSSVWTFSHTGWG
jgi:hypothetical protein